MAICRTSVICPIICLCCLLFSACAPQFPVVTQKEHSTPMATIAATVKPLPTVTPTPVQRSAPAHYTSRTFLSGAGRPDDMLFDAQGQILFSDPHNGTVSRVQSDGSVSIMLRNIAEPEGLVLLADGTLIVSEQRTNRILAFSPGATTPVVLRTLPGTASSATCKDGVDNIALDPTNNTLIIPDSPTGVVYRMSSDGKMLTQLVSGMVRPVGAVVDALGNIYVADECGGSVWRITPGGAITTFGGLHMPDDVALDAYGNLYVVDLAPAVHALIRINLQTQQHETLADQGFIEPQGLLVNAQDQIFVSDDYANVIMEFLPTT